MKEVKDLEILEEDRTDKLYNRFLSKFEVESGDSCWIWECFKNKQGYGRFKFKGKTVQAHRFSYAFFKGPITNNLIVMHKCDVTSCVNPAHFVLGTLIDNQIDCVKKGRDNPQIGSLHGMAKLTEDDVSLIKKLKGSKVTQRELALLFDIDRATISLIQNNKTWTHVQI